MLSKLTFVALCGHVLLQNWSGTRPAPLEAPRIALQCDCGSAWEAAAAAPAEDKDDGADWQVRPVLWYTFGGLLLITAFVWGCAAGAIATLLFSWSRPRPALPAAERLRAYQGVIAQLTR